MDIGSAAEAELVNVVHVSSFVRNRKFLNKKAGYGDASRVITWRILYSCFLMGSFRCPSQDIDSRVRHSFSARGLAADVDDAWSKDEGQEGWRLNALCVA